MDPQTPTGRAGDWSRSSHANLKAPASRLVLIDPLLRATRPASVAVCWIDCDPEDLQVPGVALGSVSSFAADDLESALADRPDVVWLRGHATWHAVTALAPAIADDITRRGDDAPVLIVEGGPQPPVPPWSANVVYAEHLERAASAKEGVRSSVEALAARLRPAPAVLWCEAGRGAAAVLPATTANRLQSWLDGRSALLAELNRAERRESQLVRRSFELFEQLDRADRTGTAVVRSLRFRIGTRIVRAGRRITRKEATFRAPREILARRRVVDEWRDRLARDREVGEVAVPAGALRVTYVLPELRLSGGGLVVAELVNELRLRGADARVAALRVRSDARRTALLARPLAFETVPRMMREMPEADVLVATHWSTAAWVRDLVDAGRAKHAAYFVQDYESWFYDEDDDETRARVQQSYDLIGDKIVTSTWLRDLLRADGHAATVIPPGLDLDVFYPRRPDAGSPPTVLAMARPRTPRRGFETVVATLAKVHELDPSVEIVLFGERLGEMRLPFPYRGAGVITGQERLARLYSRASVQFDGSDFQAFGRAALEGMACGAVPVVTNVGGVNEYARDEQNSLLVPPRDPEAAARAIIRVVSDSALRERLRAGGLATVPEYSMRHRARQTLELLERIARS